MEYNERYIGILEVLKEEFKVFEMDNSIIVFWDVSKVAKIHKDNIFDIMAAVCDIADLLPNRFDSEEILKVVDKMIIARKIIKEEVEELRKVLLTHMPNLRRLMEEDEAGICNGTINRAAYALLKLLLVYNSEDDFTARQLIEFRGKLLFVAHMIFSENHKKSLYPHFTVQDLAEWLETDVKMIDYIIDKCARLDFGESIESLEDFFFSRELLEKMKDYLDKYQ